MEFFLQYELCFYYYHIFSFVYLQNSSSYKNLNPNFDQEMSIFPIKFITMKQTPPPEPIVQSIRKWIEFIGN